MTASQCMVAAKQGHSSPAESSVVLANTPSADDHMCINCTSARNNQHVFSASCRLIPFLHQWHDMIWQLIATLDIIMYNFCGSPIPCNLEEGTIKLTSSLDTCAIIDFELKPVFYNHLEPAGVSQ